MTGKTSRIRVYCDLTHAVNRLNAPTGVHRYAIEMLNSLQGIGDLRVLYGFRDDRLHFCRTWENRLRDAWPRVFRRRFLHRSASKSFDPNELWAHANQTYFAGGKTLASGKLWANMLRALKTNGETQKCYKILIKEMQTFRRKVGHARSVSADIFHILFGVADYYEDTNERGCRVLMVHDILPVTHPRFFSKPVASAFFKKFVKLREERDLTLLCASRTTRNELVRHGIQPRRCRVVPLGVSDFFRPMDASSVERRLKRHALTPGKYILSVATLEPRKNLKRLLEAHRHLIRRGHTDMPLVLTGDTSSSNDTIRLRRLAASLRIPVKFLGYVTDEELRTLYSGAGVFVYLPLCEGFGLPPLEAMACGAPVITSDCSSLPEVVGDAALKVCPQDNNAIVRAIVHVLEDSGLREHLRQKGFERSQFLSWRRTAESTADVYRRILAGK